MVTAPIIHILDASARRFRFPCDNLIRTGVDMLVYGRVGETPFIASGRYDDTSGWTGMWNWTCGITLIPALRRRIITAIKVSSLAAAARATPAADDSDGWDFTVSFHLRHGERHVLPYGDVAGREALKARGATFFKAPVDPFWIALV